MRAVRVGDVLALSDMLHSIDPSLRGAACALALYRTHCADKYRKRLGYLHPEWGDGSVMGYVMLQGGIEQRRDFSDPETCAALRIVCETLLQWRSC